MILPGNENEQNLSTHEIPSGAYTALSIAADKNPFS